MRTFDVVALGELLIDFTQNGISAQGNGLFEANPGGAPGNALAMLAKLGDRTAFIGKVGDDAFGHLMKETLTSLQIDTRGVRFDPVIPTTLAMVSRLENGDRSFSFYRKPGADMMLREEEVDTTLLSDTRIFHFGSLSMTDDLARKATQTAVCTAKEAGALISFDPNLRESLWGDLNVAKEQIWWGIHHCDILKIADNEITWLTGCNDYTEGVQAIRKESDIPLILVSMGAEGSRAYAGDTICEEPAFFQSEIVDTTGAGDTFFGCVLHDVLKNGLEGRDEAGLHNMLRFANAAASLITQKKGALRVMPALTEIEALLK